MKEKLGEERTYGYVRVSTKEQNEERQLIAMKEFGLERKQIVVEKQSGKDFQRPVYQRLIKRMRSGDTLVIKSIDRLGRNYDEILQQWRVLTKEKNIYIVVLDMPLLDTRQGRDLTGVLISDIVLQLLSYVAQTERENTRQRQMEGIAAAKLRGVKFGHPRLVMPEEFGRIKDLWCQGKISSRQAGKTMGISYQTFLRRVRESGIQTFPPPSAKNGGRL